jgi:EamA domain-containing membrane protein RarD
VALLVLALPFTALPFLMLGFAAQHLAAGLLAVLNATAPLFAALLAHFVYRERLGRWRSAGLLIGFGGVALLTAGSVSFRSAQGLAAVAAVLLTSAIWAVGANFTRRRLGGMDTIALAVGSLAVAGLALAPLAAATWPATPPPLRAWVEMALPGRRQLGPGLPAVLPAAAPDRPGARDVGDLPQPRRRAGGRRAVPGRGGQPADPGGCCGGAGRHGAVAGAVAGAGGEGSAGGGGGGYSGADGA